MIRTREAAPVMVVTFPAHGSQDTTFLDKRWCVTRI
jgi:hypothetical protein